MTLDAARQPPVQHRLHGLTVLFAAAAIGRNFILPAVVGGISAARRDMGDVGVWVALIAGVPALVGATARFLTFRYRITESALIIDAGVLQKQHRVIPFDSVQNIQVRETALQRALGVVTLSVETATGGTSADAELAVLGRENAEALRKEIMAGRMREAGQPTEQTAGEALAGEVETPLVHLAPRDLVVAGATANHAGLLAVTLAGAFQFLDDLPFLNWTDRFVNAFVPQTVTSALVIGLGILVVLVVVGWIVSIVGSVVGYHDFTLSRRGGQLHKQHGLLSRYRAVIPLRRVQAIRVEESILRRPFSLASLRIATAGTAGRPTEPWGTQTVTPIARVPDAATLVGALFPDVNYAAITLERVHRRSRVRAFTKYALVLLGAAIAAAVWDASVAMIPVLMLVPAWLLAVWQYRCRGYATVGDYVLARNGVMNRVTWVVPERKVQTLHLRESPFQRRHGLASVVLDTAGGGHATIRDLGYPDAVRVVNSLRRDPAT